MHEVARTVDEAGALTEVFYDGRAAGVKESSLDEGWLVFDENPSRPEFVVPHGAVDAHCHVFGPAEVFPYAPERKYTPADAPKERLWDLRDHLGFDRNVLVQASCHGTDNRALVDALVDSGGRARGVAVVRNDITEEELDSLDVAGVRGIRFNFLPRLADPPSEDSILEMVDRINRLEWHVVMYLEAADLPDMYDFISSIPATLILDHMGRPDVSRSPEGPEFGLLLRLLEENENIWCKVSCPERLSVIGPPDYGDVVPFAAGVVEAFSDRVLWGTDWPHPNMKSHMPDDGKLVDFIPRIAPTDELQERLLVDNPMRLYWPEESGS
jgi:2-pyrone-4,6-dicarboxylate lactonase